MERHKAVPVLTPTLPVLASALVLLAATGCTGQTPAAGLTDDEKLARVEEMVAEVERRFPDVEAVTVEDVGRLLETGSVVLVDARAPREREVSWIPGSITSDEFEQDPDRYADRTVVAYCTIGHRSSEYAKRQNEQGRRVLNLRGSLLAWTHAGAPLVGPDGPTHRLHVYGETWNLAPARYETTW
ncbi:MAG: rhodanese-like domain-containing protein [Gemmatimonadetes bacterium]|nr:rhodanese-like domain-containing protein [Candidatus Palauibacter australiensis]